MALSPPHILFRDALRSDGWHVEQDSQVGSGPNPSQVLIKKGRLTRRLLVYIWNITGEGAGRKKAGRDDLDFRVQTTRSHEGDLLSPVGHLTVGLGWRDELGVFGSFDVWVKRTTGKSSSVHLSRALLEAAAADGWAEEMRRDGPTCAWKPENVEAYLEWLTARAEPRVVSVDPLDQSATGETLDLRVDPRQDWHYFALRIGDYVVMRQNGVLLDRSLWRVTAVVTDRQISVAGSNRPYLEMRCVRHGIVRSDAWLDTGV